jgi:hypothetical protein
MGSCEYGDEHSGSVVTELITVVIKTTQDKRNPHYHKN